MITIAGHGILLDIEGTTSSIRFVYDVLFPFARRELEDYLHANWKSDELAAAREQIAKDAGHSSFSSWLSPRDDANDGITLIRDEVTRLMDRDIKATGLKQLQGLIWRCGYESGELCSHVYEDVPEALIAWNEAGRDVRIFSSGSISAQKLFFGHTTRGNLLHCFGGHYDTTIGTKRDPASYQSIASQFALPPEDILFVSDIIAELDAASQAKMQTALCIRPQNDRPSTDHGHPEITDFGQIQLI